MSVSDCLDIIRFTSFVLNMYGKCCSKLKCSLCRRVYVKIFFVYRPRRNVNYIYIHLWKFPGFFPFSLAPATTLSYLWAKRLLWTSDQFLRLIHTHVLYSCKVPLDCHPGLSTFLDETILLCNKEKYFYCPGGYNLMPTQMKPKQIKKWGNW